MTNPLVKIAMTGAGIAAGVIGNKLLVTGWGAAFGEDAPTAKNAKLSAKDTKARKKQAKKDGASKQEIAEIRDPHQEQDAWKIALWTILAGVVLQSLRRSAQRGVEVAAEKVTERRPKPNRG